MGDVVLGDLNTMSIKEVWCGEKFQKVRNFLVDNREKIPLCRYCDFVWYNLSLFKDRSDV